MAVYILESAVLVNLMCFGEMHLEGDPRLFLFWNLDTGYLIIHAWLTTYSQPIVTKTMDYCFSRYIIRIAMDCPK